MFLFGNAAFAPGKVGQALTFDGLFDYGIAVGSPALDVGTGPGMTIEVWIKPGDLSTLRPLVEWNSGGGSIGAHLWVSVNSPGSLYANLLDPSGTAHLIETSAGVLQTGVWQHVALTYEKASGMARLFVNGALAAQASLGAFTPQTSHPFYTGLRPSGAFSGIYFTGAMDELSLYQRALSSTEVADIHAAGAFGKCLSNPPPFIVTQPQSLTVTQGGTATFTVAATGNAPLIYHWRRNAATLSVNTNAALVLTGVTSSNAGTYSVVVSNAFGFAVSSNAVLTVVPPGNPPVITSIAPTNQTVPAGSNAAITVTATGTSPLAYRWFRNGQLVVGQTNVTAAFTPAQTNHTGSYFCIVSNAFGSATSVVAILTVTPPTGMPPVILSIAPTNQVIGVGSITFINVTVTGTGPLLYRWFQNGSLVVGQTNSSINFSPVEINHAGAYFCVVSNSFGVATSGVAVLTVILPGTAPVILSIVPTNQVVFVGSNALITLNATGTPPLFYRWSRDGTNLPGATNNIIAFAPAVTTDSGTYRCVVSNLLGSVLSTGAVLTVITGTNPPAVLSISPTNLTVPIGTNAMFTVTATGSAPLSYQWQFGGVSLPGRTNFVLAFPAQLTNSGIYRCVVSNPLGVAISPEAVLNVTLPTSGPPVITFPTTLSLVVAQPGSNAVLRVTATGEQPLGYHWFLNGPTQPLPGVTTATNNLINIQPAQAGAYTVVVSNRLGMATNLGWVVNVLGGGGGGTINLSMTPAMTNVLVFDAPGSTNRLPVGVQFLCQLYVATNTEPLWPLGGAGGFNGPGRTLGGAKRMTGIVTGQVVQAQIRAWDSLFGASYEQALENGGRIGSSIIVPVAPLFGSAAGAPLLGLQSFWLTPGLPPVITAQPQSLTVTQGMNAAFSVSAGGSGPRSFQWRVNSLDIPGANGPTLLLSQAQPNQSGAYAVLISNAVGTVTSDIATLTVLGTNRPPVAFGQGVTLAEDIPVAFTLTAFDPDGDALTFNIGTPAFGTLTGTPPNLVYRPNSNYYGMDGFSFTVSDGQFTSTEASVQLFVAGQDDFPIAFPASVTLDEDTSAPITLQAYDGDGDPLSYVATTPAHGTLAGTPPNLIYTPVQDYHGPDSFTFTVNDGISSVPISAPATISITVRPVNDWPVAASQSVTLDEDTTTAITLGASDVDGDGLTWNVTAPAHGTLAGTPPNLTYTPAANYHGPDSFTFRVNDGSVDSTEAAVSLTVRAVNDPPTANAQFVSVNEDSTVAIHLVASDLDGDALAYVVSAPAHGALSGTAPDLIYTPAPGYHGPDSFTFRVNDGTVNSPVAAVSITVVSVNDPPVPRATVSPLAILDPANTNRIVLSPNGSNAVVILDASGSTDPEGDAMEFFWLENSVVLGGGLRFTNVFTVGEHTVTLLADDGTDAATATVMFLVIAPGEAVEEILLMLNSSGLAENRLRPLRASLKAVSATLERGNLNTAANQLRAFLNKVRAQVAPGDPALAAELTAACEALLRVMEGR
jgi:hypothetical protein